MTMQSTSALSLISHPLCPFVQRAAIVLLEKGVPFERVNVDLSAKPAWFLEISPTGKVPLLRVNRAEGIQHVLFESAAICEYLEESQPGAHLHPEDLLMRAEHRAWMEYASATLTDAWGYLNAMDSVTAGAKGDAFVHKLDRVERTMGDGPYFNGAAFGLVDAFFAPIFRYFDVMTPEVGMPLFEAFPKVSAWRNQLAVRRSVIGAVVENYGALFHEHLRRHDALLAARLDG